MRYNTGLSIHKTNPVDGLKPLTNRLGDKAIRSVVYEAIWKWTLTGTHMTAYETFWKQKVKSGQVDWDDLRIRKFTEERNKIDSYLELRVLVHFWEVRTCIHIFTTLQPLTNLCPSICKPYCFRRHSSK